MIELGAILDTYARMATELDRQLDQARVSGGSRAIEWLEKQQRINDSAYFLLAWGQLEAKINLVCEIAITKRQSSADWEMRRAWDIFPTDAKELRRERFLDRVALVLDKSRPEFSRVLSLYGQRNQIAHGRSIASGIDVPSIIRDLYQIESQLRD